MFFILADDVLESKNLANHTVRVVAVDGVHCEEEDYFMSSRLITIVGGSGFIGHHLVGRLAAKGYQIRLAVRDTEKASLLMTQGNVGQIVGMQTNIRNKQSVERAVAGADIVINLVGLLYQGGAQKFEAVHVDGAATVAEAAKAAGARQLVHLSALGADEESASEYARTKAFGERAVLAKFADATIIRPSVVFGADDDFTNKFAALTALIPVLPMVDGAAAKMQPVWIEDLANAIVKIIETSEHQGKVWEFGGPDALPLCEIIDGILKVTKRTSFIIPMPGAIMGMMAFFLQLIPGKPILTKDQVRLLQVDNVVSGDHPGFAEMGIKPVKMQGLLPKYLTRYRKGGGLSEQHA